MSKEKKIVISNSSESGKIEGTGFSVSVDEKVFPPRKTLASAISFVEGYMACAERNRSEDAPYVVVLELSVGPFAFAKDMGKYILGLSANILSDET